MLKPRTGAALGITTLAATLVCCLPGRLVAAAAARAAQVAPTDSAAPVISGTAVEGETLSVSAGSWGGDQPVSVSYQWQRCDATAQGCAPVPGAIGSSYLVSAADLSSTLVVTVTAVNDAGSAVAVSAPSAVVAAASTPAPVPTETSTTTATAPSAPVATSQPNPVGTAKQGSTLTVGPSGWNGAAPFSFGYQWQRCSGSDPVCTSLGGATGEDYVPGVADVGTRLRVLVTATNAAGSAQVASNLSAPVLAAPPLVSPPVELAAPTVSGSAQVGQTLTASPGGWSGVGTLRESYAWQRCGADGGGCVAIAGADAASYLLVAADSGARLRVVVTATRPGGSASAASAPSDAVGLVPPGPPALPGAPDPYHARAQGYDASFPDCGQRTIPVGGFLIVGVNDGRPFTSNPCFAREYASARAQDVPAGVYLNAAYSGVLLGAITPACSARSAEAAASAALRRAYALGCSEAAASLLGPLAAAPPAVIWLDVETSNAWSARTSLNAATLAGMRAELSVLAPKTSVGVYSDASWWWTITGGVQTPTMPEWTPVPPRSGASCPPSFAGGPVWLWQGGSASLDVDHPC